MLTDLREAHAVGTALPHPAHASNLTAALNNLRFPIGSFRLAIEHLQPRISGLLRYPSNRVKSTLLAQELRLQLVYQREDLLLAEDRVFHLNVFDCPESVATTPV
jgi:hypothetical protein